jgi:hypothetical protein
MHYIIFPSKDTTIYSKYPEINTGLDEILEISKEVSSSVYFNRGIWQSGSYYKRFDYVYAPESAKHYYAVAENIETNPTFGYQIPNSKGTMMVEYSSPNTNKPLHLGHIRNIYI